MAARDDRPSLGDVASDLARRWANQRLAAVQTYGRILADYGAGRSTGSAAVGAFARLAAEEAARYPSDVIGLGTAFAAAVAGRAGATLETGAASAARRATPVHDLEIAGPLGGTATGDFYLSNPHDRPADLSFVSAQFFGPSGETGPAVSLEPAVFTLPAGQEQLIKVSAALGADLVQAGRSYAATVAVAGFDEMVLRVRLTVLDPG